MLCKFLMILAAVSISSELVSTATDKVVCYHGTWARYRNGNGQFLLSNIDTSLCTHLIYSFVGLNEADGSVRSLDEWCDYGLGTLAAFNALKTQNSNLKTLVAIGGWNEGSTKYSAIAASSELRAAFIASALNFVQTNGFDGFDLDWEYPGQRGGAAADIANFATLIKEFKEAFEPHGLLLTAAVAATTAAIELSYDVPALSQYLDIINVMAYDYHGSWDAVTGQNAPLYASSLDTSTATQQFNVDASIKGWIAKGASPEKLVLGLGMYGRSYTLSDSSNTALGAPISGAGTAGPYTAQSGMLGYNEICEKQLAGGWTRVWDDVQKVPYTYNGDQWIGYDDPESIALKVEYAKNMGLAGVMIWSIETEDFKGICGPKYPLLNAIKNSLGTTSSNTANVTASNTASNNASDTASNTANNNDSDTASNTASNNASGTASNTTSNNASDTASDTSTSASEICTAAGFARHPTDCTIFYYCSPNGDNYIASQMKCSSGLYFDRSSSTCNWPSEVEGC